MISYVDIACPLANACTSHNSSGGGFSYDKNIPGWSAPFVCGGHDTKLVHRSNALLNSMYGKQFRYREVVPCTGRVLGFFRAAVVTALTYAVMLLVLLHPSRYLLTKFVLPAPGTGPSKEERESGYFNVSTCDSRVLSCCCSVSCCVGGL
jgi:short subunit dehydrogenase-like uncharacterized protein